MTLLDLEVADETQGRIAQWRLDRVELVNWGTFDGHHRITIARQGHLFTGASGSGKSSLLDAIATVLTPSRVLRFNAAAQEGATRGDDRSFVTYVRGAWSKEADAELDRAVSSYLRRGATRSGVLLRFADGRGGAVSLARLFHLSGSSTDKGDLHDLAFAVRDAVELAALQRFAERGIDARGIKAAWPTSVVTTNGGHKAYFARVQRLLGIPGDNALPLLHRTQSAKNLGGLDQLFRNFMLDEPATFDRAKNATEQFAELREAHRLVVEAREQVEALLALEPAITAYEAAVAADRRALHLRGLLTPFEERLRLRLTLDEAEATRERLASAESTARTAARSLARVEEDLRGAHAAARSAGSERIEVEQLRLRQAQEVLTAVQGHAVRIADSLRNVGVAVPTDGREYRELQRLATASGDRPDPVDYALHEGVARLKQRLRDLDAEIVELRRATSNLPPRLLQVRRQIAEHLRLPEEALPFAGELIDVRPIFAAWTGAIERVLRPIATTLLVPHDRIPAVRRWVEGRSIGERLVFEDVAPPSHTPRATRSNRSLVNRIDLADGHFHDWLAVRLAGAFDFECVDSPDDLEHADRAVTIGGLVKNGTGRYEKNDRSRIDDRTTWVLGSRNDDKIDLLEQQRLAVDVELRQASQRLDAARTHHDSVVRRAAVLQTVLKQDWAQIDVAAARAEVDHRKLAVRALTLGDTDLQAALSAVAGAEAEAKSAREQERQAAFAETAERAHLETLTHEATVLRTAVSTVPLTDQDTQDLEARYRSQHRRLSRETLSDAGRKVGDSLHDEAQRAQRAAGDARSAFERAAQAIGLRWPGPTADLTARIDDRAGYRALRERIEARGLPEHEQNFRRLLRDKSHELIGHLRSDLLEAPRLVDQRISPVNVSLGRSMFDRDRYLKIKVRTQRGPEVQQFLDDLRAIVDGAWGEEDLASAEARFVRLEAVMRRLSSSEPADAGWRRRVLDTREHVTFQAQEVAPDGTVAAVHDSSAGLSGGQRQKLVIFCLAAALRYQLAEDEQQLPAYATVILDEAFDKADSAYTRMAMDVFVEFGFHMILATPQKLLQTIEPYVGGVTVIANPTRKLSVVESIAWDETA